MNYTTPAEFEDMINKLVAEGFNQNKAVEIMLDILVSHGYSAGVEAYKNAVKTCNKDYCEV